MKKSIHDKKRFFYEFRFQYRHIRPHLLQHEYTWRFYTDYHPPGSCGETMTFEEFFDFNDLDLHTNRSGQLSHAQQARWQQDLSRGRRFQHGGVIILSLVLGGILLGGTGYLNSYFRNIPPKTLSWIKIAGILAIAFPVLLAAKGILVTARRTKKFEAILGDGEVKRLVGPVQLTRVFQWDPTHGYSGGYVYTLAVDKQELQVYRAARLGSKEFGRALFAVFGLPLPPKQSFMKIMKHVPQTAVSHEKYAVYYLEGSWKQRHVCSIEKVDGQH